jgi:DNA polymerase III sliding clamp (beta) subunit (PCNA family)
VGRSFGGGKLRAPVEGEAAKIAFNSKYLQDVL